MACGKFRVLSKNPKGRDVAPTDKFSFNSGFSSPLAKIKIQTIIGKVESSAERADTQEKIDEERKHQIEACLTYDNPSMLERDADDHHCIHRPASFAS